MSKKAVLDLTAPYTKHLAIQNEELKEALREIANYRLNQADGGWSGAVGAIQRMAEQALRKAERNG